MSAVLPQLALPGERPSSLQNIFGSWCPKAVVFDCDGLLMDTESLWTQTQEIVCAQLGIALDQDLRHRLVGLPASRIGPLMAECAGAEPATVIKQLLDVNEDLVQKHGRPMRGARELVEAMSAKVPLAVASNSARRILDVAMAQSTFSRHLAATVSAEQVALPKPAPDVYLAAAEALGVSAEECLAFEDSEAGAKAAVAAGMKVIAVPQVTSQKPLAHAFCDSLESAELRAWVAAWT
ncbi:HAD family phosphatase [Paenarthrobacter ureafaciens]|nr:HAD family phosphatase [Paenarthrobacter ureafaciens]AMB41741.1 phosphatase [Arthrobacter sp. ATCC 21022]RWW94422.1 HAD family phosphatase [Paenarthrobacter ureafaciens]